MLSREDFKNDPKNRPGFVKRVLRVLEVLEKEGEIFGIVYGYRSPELQAILYRKGHTTKEVDRKVKELLKRGRKDLAEILVGVGPQDGTWSTNAGPGESYHNWGCGVDLVRMVKGKPNWDTKGKAMEPWKRMIALAKAEGLYSGEGWGDLGHLQLYPEGNALDCSAFL